MKWSKGGKSVKHKLCIIMLINPSEYNALEKIVFDLQITIAIVHLVQISSRSVHCITTDTVWKIRKVLKSLKSRGLVPTIQPEPDFSQVCSFWKILDNVELITNIESQKILKTGCRKKHQKFPRNGGLPPFVTPKIFYKNKALSLVYPYGALTSCKKLRNN